MNVTMKKGKSLYYYCFLWLIVLNFCDASKFSRASRTVEVNKLLRRLNKTPVKSIKSPDGDIIDCILVSQQPAFDHPLLKNHTIQFRPSNYPEGQGIDDRVKSTGKGNSKLPITQLWHMKGRCPKGTIPIRRTKEEDVLRANSLHSFGRNKHESFPMPKAVSNTKGSEFAVVEIKGDKYNGAKADINAWNPQVQLPDEDTTAQVWITGGAYTSDANIIEAGWMVSPRIYGDNNTRLFIHWTKDWYESTGCFNLLCPGFIQVKSGVALGATITPLSTYGGSQYGISIFIFKDPKDGNWWLEFGKKYVLGYWPASLFTNLAGSGTMVEWGGRALNLELDGMHTTTQMGSGHFPEEGLGKASFVKNIQIIDGSNRIKDPDSITTFAPKPNCYNASIGKNDDWGNYFYYGGPGRNTNCP